MTHHMLLAVSTGGLKGTGSMFLHFTERFAKAILVVLTFGIILWKGAPIIWMLLTALVIGAVVVPSFSPKVSSSIASLNQGSAVGTTGASIGTLAILGVLFAVTAFLAFRKG